MSVAQLPDDVLRYELFPFLGFEDRMNANRVLKPSYRIGKKMDKTLPIKLHIRMVIPFVRRLIVGGDNENPRQRRMKIVQLVKSFRKYAVILQHNINFREVTIGKLISFTQDEEFAGTTWSNSSKEYLIHISLEALYAIKKFYPYKYEVTVPI
jgi:hypothetical protein